MIRGVSKEIAGLHKRLHPHGEVFFLFKAYTLVGLAMIMIKLLKLR